MSLWTEIACQRGHETHETRRVHVDLSVPHGYHDYAQVPTRLARSFDMMIYPPETYPVDNGNYCPAHDAVSETIVSHGIWEPRETALVLAVCESAEPGQMMADFGSQIGWFSLLAMSCGLDVCPMDADPANMRLLTGSAHANGWLKQVHPLVERIDASTPAFDSPTSWRLAKIDVEGAENQVVRVLWPSIEAGLVDHLLIEVSPVFAGYYGDLVLQIIDAGYRAYLLPPKRQPPYTLDDPEHDMETHRFDRAPRETVRALVNEFHQENCWFVREGASW